VNLDPELCGNETEMTLAVAVEGRSRMVVVEGHALLNMVRLAGQSWLPRKGPPHSAFARNNSGAA
jgi:hypothetical protein